jgi:putative aldouronate transport system permease protein
MSLVRNDVGLWPVGFNLDAYKRVLESEVNRWALIWTAILTAICTLLSMTMTTICAYPLIYPQLKGRKIINTFIVLTMYLNAGLVPNYLLYNSLNMINHPIVLIVPSCLSVFNMILMRTFFYGIPDSLRESAEIDGAGPIKVLVSIYLPLSMPVIATLILFYAVGRWNGWSDALFFMNSNEAARYRPIQLLLYYILQNANSTENAAQEGFTIPGFGEGVKFATVMFATVPILVVYPWLQKYFIAGVTLGAIKE